MRKLIELIKRWIMGHRILYISRKEITPPILYSEYGLLYNWYAATDSRKITSSDDWVVPGYLKFWDLCTYLDPLATPSNNVAGGLMKEIGYWIIENNPYATNTSKFNARATGLRSLFGGFSQMLTDCKFWSVDTMMGEGRIASLNSINPNIFYASSTSAGYYRGNYKYGLNIRPVKNSTTLSHGESGTYTGNDGKVYRTICIGTQEWLADNLMETRFRNGDIIPWHGANPANFFTAAEWAALTSAGVCAYDNDVTFVTDGFTFPT